MSTAATGGCYVTKTKPTVVSHSAVGYFTRPETEKIKNLIIGKRTLIEIYSIIPQDKHPPRLQLIKELPVYGRIATLQLFRPNGKDRDLLLITTEKYNLFLFGSNHDGELITWLSIPVWEWDKSYCGQMCIVDPLHALIGVFRLNCDNEFKVIPYPEVIYHQTDDIFSFRLDDYPVVLPMENRRGYGVLDIKFVYCIKNPKIAVLYRGNDSDRHITFYHLFLPNGEFDAMEGPFCFPGSGIELLIPDPWFYVLGIAEESVHYIRNGMSGSCDMPAQSNQPISQSHVYGEFKSDGHFSYLLGDGNGNICSLVTTEEEPRIEYLGTTAVASCISCLMDSYVFVGSSYGDSQLIRLKLDNEGRPSEFEIYERFIKLVPVVDLCVVDGKKQGIDQVVTCSGAYIDGSLRVVVHNGIHITTKASGEYKCITGIWSLKETTCAQFDTFLVVSTVTATSIFRVHTVDGIVELTDDEAEMCGFSVRSRTEFCQTAIEDQLVQVTSYSVRLVSSRTGKLCHEWSPKNGEIYTATATATHVLLATSINSFVYLEIKKGQLNRVASIELESNVHCLDIHPIGDASELAAVGLWASDKEPSNYFVDIYSLPDMNLLCKIDLGYYIAASVLLVSFEEILYLLCAHGERISEFKWETSEHKLTEVGHVDLGVHGTVELRTFSANNTTNVFVASMRPALIYSSNKRLLDINVNLEEARLVCPFNTCVFGNSLVYVEENNLTIGSIDGDIDYCQKIQILSIPLQEQARFICHQKKTRTYGICTSKHVEDREEHFVHLLDETFTVKASYKLDLYEHCCSILSCSFSPDLEDYFCVGTAYFNPGETKRQKGRILVLAVRDEKLELVANQVTTGAVYSLCAFRSKLLAAINREIRLYDLILRDDNTREFQSLASYLGEALALDIQTTKDGVIVVISDQSQSISTLIYKDDERVFKEQACDANWMSGWSALPVLKGANNNRSQYRTCSLRLGDGYGEENVEQVMFVTPDGTIGTMTWLRREVYDSMRLLQKILKERSWVRVYDDDYRAINENIDRILDGNLIQSFLLLPDDEMREISTEMSRDRLELVAIVRALSRL